jgi:hypothetical protein
VAGGLVPTFLAAYRPAHRQIKWSGLALV